MSHLNIQSQEMNTCINQIMKTRISYGSILAKWYMWGKVLDERKDDWVVMQLSAVQLSVSSLSALSLATDSSPCVRLCCPELSGVLLYSSVVAWVVTQLSVVELESCVSSLQSCWWFLVLTLLLCSRLPSPLGVRTAWLGIWTDPIRLSCIVPWSTSVSVRLILSSFDRF